MGKRQTAKTAHNETTNDSRTFNSGIFELLNKSRQSMKHMHISWRQCKTIYDSGGNVKQYMILFQKYKYLSILF